MTDTASSLAGGGADRGGAFEGQDALLDAEQAVMASPGKISHRPGDLETHTVVADLQAN